MGSKKKKQTLKERAFKEVIKRPGITSAQLNKTLKKKGAAGSCLYDYLKNGLVVRESIKQGNRTVFRYYPSDHGYGKIQKTNPKFLKDITSEFELKRVELNINGTNQIYWEVEGVLFTDKKNAKERLEKITIEDLSKKIPLYQKRIMELEREYEISKTFFDRMASLVGLKRGEDETLGSYFNRLQKTIERIVVEKDDYYRELQDLHSNNSKEDRMRYERGSYR